MPLSAMARAQREKDQQAQSILMETLLKRVEALEKGATK
jgi:hypothetical protein